MMLNKEYEAMHREDLEQLQLERLQSTLHRVYRNVAFYHQIFDDRKTDVEKIRNLADVNQLPFTTKEDLKKSYPYDMFAVPLRDIVRIHSTSGTTGKPIVVGYTKNDINTWTSLMARVMTAAGITEQDVVQIAYSYSLFTGGFGFHFGAERLGSSVIPAGGEDVVKQIMIMKDFKTTVLAGTPGFALHIGTVLKDSGIHPEELSLKTGIFGAEPWSRNMRLQIEESLRIETFDNYGLTEIMGPGVAFECSAKQGLHVNEDHFMVEIIDPETRMPAAPGKQGELVFTTITKQGFPLIRYRTGDISAFLEGDCPCGRTLRRIERISGRTDDMMIIEGINAFPSQIEEVLLQIEGVKPHYQIILERSSGMDTMEVQVEVEEQVFSDETKVLEKLRLAIQQRIKSAMGIVCKITLVEPKKLNRSTGGKLKRIVDNRDR
ncbi:MAG: phenylacetate--CoA ligase family protein [Spirochaetales bacterium]|nr:MAG: phenylacetate--CoA ligase family protein [Spirochaetales bacterium]